MVLDRCGGPDHVDDVTFGDIGLFHDAISQICLPLPYSLAHH